MEEGQERYVIKVVQEGGEEVVKIWDTIENRALKAGDKISEDAKRVADAEIKAAKETVKANDDKMAAIRKQWEQLEKRVAIKQKQIGSLGTGAGDVMTAQRLKAEIASIRQEQARLDAEAEAYAKEIEKAEKNAKDLDAVVKSTEKKQASMRTEMRNAKEEAARLLTVWRAMSEAEKNSARGQELKKKIDELIDKAGDLKDAMDDATRATSGRASDTRTFDAISEGLDTVISGYGVYQGVLASAGVKEEELMAMQTKFQAILAASNALKTIQNNLQKESNLMMGVASVKAWAQAKAEAAATSATWGHTAAQKAFNLVAKANPYVLMASAIITVVGALAMYISGTNKAKQAEEKRQKELERINAAAEEMKKKDEEHAALIGGEYSSSLANLVSTYRKLQVEYKNLKSKHEKTKWIKDNAEEFKKLGVSVNTVDQAENVLVDNTAIMVEAFKYRAQAAAAAAESMQAYTEAAKLEFEKQSVVEERTKKYSNRYKAGDKFSGATSDYGLEKGVDYKTYKSQPGIFLTEKGAAKANAWEVEKGVVEGGYDEKIAELNKQAEKWVDKQVEAEQKIKELMDGAQILSFEDPTKDPKEPNGRSAYDIEEMKRQMEKTNAELENKARDLAFEVREAEIDGMQEGFEKERAKIDLEYEKTIAQIAGKRAEMVNALQDAEKKQWDIDHPNAEKDGLKFTPTVFSLSSADEKRLGEMEKQAGEAREKAMEEVNRKEQASWNEYLKQYGDYQQRRIAIQREYDQKIADAGGDNGAVAILNEQQKEELEELDKLFGKVANDFADLFADASLKSANSIQRMIDKYKLLIDYMQGGGMTGEGGGKVSREQVLAAGFTDADLKKIQGDPEKLKAIADQIESLKAALSDKAPFKAFTDNVKKAVEQFKKDGDLGNMVANITDNLSQMLGMFKGMGEDIAGIIGIDTGSGSVFGKAFGGAEGVLGLGQGVGKIMSGDILGGIADGISGIAKIADIFGGSNIDELTKANDELTRSNNALQYAMDKLSDEFANAKVSEVADVAGKMAENLESQIANWQQLMSNEAKMWERGSHSIGGNVNADKASKNVFEEISKATGKKVNALSDVFGLTPEEMAEIPAEVYAELQGLIQKHTNEHTGQNLNAYLDSYRDMAGQMDKITEQSIEKVSQLGKDELQNEWKSLLANMDTTSSDFADSLNQKLRNAIANALVSNKYGDKLALMREQIAKMIEDGNYEAAKKLQEEYAALSEQAMSDVSKAFESAGISDYVDQSFKREVAASVTQDTMDEVNGRLTAVQIDMQMMVSIGQQSQQNLANIERYTAHIPAMARDIALMRADINEKL